MTSERMFPEVYEAPGYAITKELGDGKGNTARVFLATRLATNESVAIKFYNPLWVDVNQKRQISQPERFRREFLAVCQINHPNVVKVMECGNLPDDATITRPPYIVMELLDGDLQKKMTAADSFGPTRLAATIRLLRKIAEGLAVVHRAKVIHRDIKPDNIMFKGEEPQVADFGFAKLFDEDLLSRDALAKRRLTEVGERLGTMAYMSPEQIAAAPHVSEQADIFSFGVMMYELLTGRLPFPKDPSEQMDAFAKRRLRPDPIEADSLDEEIPFPLRRLCVRCLLYEHKERPTTDELVTELRNLDNTPG